MWMQYSREEAPVEAPVDTGKVDSLGRPILVDRYGRRKWRREDYIAPAGYTPEEWHRVLQIHGPVTCG